MTIKMGTETLLNFKANPNEKQKKRTNHKISLPPFFSFVFCVFSRLVVVGVPFQPRRHSSTPVYHPSYHASPGALQCRQSRVAGQAQLTAFLKTKTKPLSRTAATKTKQTNKLTPTIAEIPVYYITRNSQTAPSFFIYFYYLYMKLIC